jgi:hypothetical protein
MKISTIQLLQLASLAESHSWVRNGNYLENIKKFFYLIRLKDAFTISKNNFVIDKKNDSITKWILSNT